MSSILEVGFVAKQGPHRVHDAVDVSLSAGPADANSTGLLAQLL